MTVKRRMFEEDMICDYCGMEIWGPGIRSGYENGQTVDGCGISGWMHEDLGECDENIRGTRDDAQFQDGFRSAWGKPPTPPPNVPSDYKFKDRR